MFLIKLYRPAAFIKEPFVIKMAAFMEVEQSSPHSWTTHTQLKSTDKYRPKLRAIIRHD